MEVIALLKILLLLLQLSVYLSTANIVFETVDMCRKSACDQTEEKLDTLMKGIASLTDDLLHILQRKVETMACAKLGGEMGLRLFQCFRYVDSKRSWSQAQTECKAMKGRLAVVETEAKTKDLYDLLNLTRPKNPFLWVGASFDRGFRWLEGTRVEDRLWATVPDRAGSGLCVGMGYQHLNHSSLTYMPCRLAQPFICEL